jgi:lipopolysaccharide export system ATP-binding protein
MDEAQALLEDAGLSNRAEQAAGRLSGGERRRLELARALAANPRVLLLDEPFSGVDPVGVEDLQVRIRSIASQGVAVLITDHAVRETMGACDRVVLLDGGRVMVEGTPQQVAQDPRVRSRYLGSSFHIEDGLRRD